jgi:hypothetical protein
MKLENVGSATSNSETPGACPRIYHGDGGPPPQDIFEGGLAGHPLDPGAPAPLPKEVVQDTKPSPQQAAAPKPPKPPKVLDCLSPEPESTAAAEAQASKPSDSNAPKVLDSVWMQSQASEDSTKTSRSTTKPPDPPDPEEDYKEAQRVWMEIFTGRLQNIQDMMAIWSDTQSYIYQSMREAYFRRVKIEQKLLEEWSKAFFGWE